MARPRNNDLLPQGVHAVPAAGGRTYYYWQPGRGTARARERISLGSDARSPEFWRKLNELIGAPPVGLLSGSWAALDRKWRGDPKNGAKPSREWEALSQGTRDLYAVRMRQIVARWGSLPVSGTNLDGVVALRDTLSGAVAANQLVKVIRIAMKFGRPHGFPSSDPTAGLEALAIGEVGGATPWPEWAYQIVRAEAPVFLQRAAFLGRATGQRRSDLVRVGKRNRRNDGIDFNIQKRRNKPHFVPLLPGELAEIDGWAALDIGPYIVDARGKPMTGDAVANQLKVFCKSHPRLKDAEVFMHGLRALAVCDRRIAGMTHQEISGQLCMSSGMVMQYSKAIDTEVLGRAANARRTAQLSLIGVKKGTGL